MGTFFVPNQYSQHSHSYTHKIVACSLSQTTTSAQVKGKFYFKKGEHTMAKPTNRQKSYALDIAQNLKIPLPTQESLEEYGKYIASHAEKNREVIDEMKARKRKATTEVKEKYPIAEVEPRLRLHQNRTRISTEPLNSPENIIKFMRQQMRPLDKEHIYVVNLDSELRAINMCCVAIGTINNVGTCCGEIFKTAILSNSDCLILFHNHPSACNVKPSREDDCMTREIIECGKIVGVNVLDHIIVNDSEEYYSYRKQSRIFMQ